ncbi:MAG: hypothetical protein ACRENP_14145 [Longimicrobiales bacterium]
MRRGKVLVIAALPLLAVCSLEVADNLRWLVEPAGAASFNAGIRNDHIREVRFSRVGVYSVSAQSAAWCAPSYGGNTLTVEVVARLTGGAACAALK